MKKLLLTLSVMLGLFVFVLTPQAMAADVVDSDQVIAQEGDIIKGSLAEPGDSNSYI